MAFVGHGFDFGRGTMGWPLAGFNSRVSRSPGMGARTDWSAVETMVAVVAFFEVGLFLHPFHQLPPAADLRAHQPVGGVGEFLLEVRISIMVLPFIIRSRRTKDAASCQPGPTS